MLKVMLDTNVLVKFAFVLNKLYRGVKVPKNLKKYEFILEKLEQAKFFNVMSDWNRFELRDVLMKLKLAEVFFMSGFTVDEFRDAKEEKIGLSKKHIESVNEVVQNIWQFCLRKTQNMDIRKIRKFTKKGYSSMDIVLLHQAELSGCNYFVTNDSKLYLSKELKKEFNVKICPVNELKNKI